MTLGPLFFTDGGATVTATFARKLRVRHCPGADSPVGLVAARVEQSTPGAAPALRSQGWQRAA